MRTSLPPPVRAAACTVALTLLPALAPAVSAQNPPATEWQQGSSLSLVGGIATSSGDVDPAVGGAINWEITPRVALDASAIWLRGGRHEDAIFGSIGARYGLTTDRPARPFVSAGLGLYRATFDDDDPAGMPGFYGRRLMMHTPTAAFGPRRTFDDFAVRAGGGVEVFASRRVSIRPEAQLVIVMRDSHTRVVPLFDVQLVWHFENHPITPARR